MTERARRLRAILTALVLCLPLTACAIGKTLPMPPYEAAPEAAVPTEAAKPYISFYKAAFDIDRDTIIGARAGSYQGANGSHSCIVGEGDVDVHWTSSSIDSLGEQGGFAKAFAETLRSKGYNVIFNPDVIFEPDQDRVRADLTVSGSIVKIVANLCDRSRKWGSDPVDDSTAEVFFEVLWYVYDTDLKKDVLKVRTNGYVPFKDDRTGQGRWESAYEAFGAAARNLANNPEFIKAVTDKAQKR